MTDETIEIRSATSYWVRLALIIGFITLPCVALPVDFIRQDLHVHRHPSYGLLLLVLVPLSLVVGVWWDRRRWVALFDPEGAELKTGARFPWSDFQEVRRVRGSRGALSHFAIVFRGGSGRVYPRGIDDGGSVLAFVGRLESKEKASAVSTGA